MALRFAPNRNSGVVALVVQQAVSVSEISTEWTEVATSTYTALSTDRYLWIGVNPCTITWPPASSMTDAEVLVIDGVGTANANNIHNVCTGGELISGSADRKITNNWGFLRIKRNLAADGYVLVG